MTVWCVIYLWRGERHRHSRTFNRAELAGLLADEMVADDWVAWVERLR